MKKHKVWFGILAAGLLVMLFAACSDSNVTPTSTSTSALEVTDASTSYALVSAPIEFDDATVDNAIRERPNPNIDPRGPKPLPHPFVRLLKALNLDSTQTEAVRGFLKDHDDCIKSSLVDLRDVMQAILDSAIAARKEVIDAYKAGTITREEAAIKIREINQTARDAMKNADVRQKIREAMKACDDEFIASLKSILNSDQLAILDAWLQAHHS